MNWTLEIALTVKSKNLAILHVLTLLLQSEARSPSQVQKALSVAFLSRKPLYRFQRGLFERHKERQRWKKTARSCGANFGSPGNLYSYTSLPVLHTFRPPLISDRSRHVRFMAFIVFRSLYYGA